MSATPFVFVYTSVHPTTYKSPQAIEIRSEIESSWSSLLDKAHYVSVSFEKRQINYNAYNDDNAVSFFERCVHFCAPQTYSRDLRKNLNSKINHQDEGSSCKHLKMFKALLRATP